MAVADIKNENGCKIEKQASSGWAITSTTGFAANPKFYRYNEGSSDYRPYMGRVKFSPPEGALVSTLPFTQMVWKSSRFVGCARACCDKGDVWACAFEPTGNTVGQFGHNVRPLKKPFSKV
eukprot:GHVN01015879.1.p1 GENE.GHVN01015879.1~~GHVN01015879.1.p1  ORF type:complete len:121 (-),score=13.57 GHVN01015879.1:52-414(-)